jgi:hypothetical protein
MLSAVAPDVRVGRHARDNPFRVERVLAVRYRPQGTSWSELLARLQALRYRAAICGPQGAGKTTLLEDLAGRLANAGRTTQLLSLRSESRADAARLARAFLSGSAPGEVLLVDGAEQLGPLMWRTLSRRSLRHAGLIITAHSAGRLPTLVECRTDVPLLEAIVAELVPDDLPSWQPHLAALFRAHGGNVRACLRSLYDAYAGNCESILAVAEGLS